MQIGDLSSPVTASKADWLPGTTWIGFTPQGRGAAAAAKCEASVNKQIGRGYILERVTINFEEPNYEFVADPRVEADREKHRKLSDRLVAVHKLVPSSRKLSDIIGDKEFERLQDIWARPEARKRWSVAFPIIETYRVVGFPRAKDVFSPKVFRKIYQSQAALLRPLDDEARAAIADLEIVPLEAPNAWIAIENEIAKAERSTIPTEIQVQIGLDLSGCLEGETEERRCKIRLRAAWLADRFARARSAEGKLTCEVCGFDPKELPDAGKISARSCLDVHHRNPLHEGSRLTGLKDFILLCPTCHRLEHLRMALRLH